MASIRRIAVLTSGGDAPGMNAAIRAVTRSAIEKGWEVFGVKRGFSGLVRNDLFPLGRRDVSGIIQTGGTVLGSARLPEFSRKDIRKKALDHLAGRGIDALLVIGGNGSQTGGAALHDDGFPVIGVASTIDNDLIGSDITIGVDTALNIVLESIDRLKTTASSHHRAFLVETMGRNCGYLALMAGIAGGAEVVVIPEIESDPVAIEQELRSAYDKGKSHAIVVVAEGAKYNAEKLAEYFVQTELETGFGLRVTKLGYVQRGGAPTAADRLLGTRLGSAAVDFLSQGHMGCVTGTIKDEIVTTPYSEVIGHTKGIDADLFKLAGVLAK